METAWAGTTKHPLKTRDLHWRTGGLTLPFNKFIADKTDRELLNVANNSDEAKSVRIWAALGLTFKRRQKAGNLTAISCLQVGRTKVLHLPGEMFIEYQLAAKKMRPGKNILVASYGNYETGYVGTKKSYAQGGYETSVASQVGPGSEDIIMNAMRKLLR